MTMVGDTVDLEVDERWTELPRLLERVRRVKGRRGTCTSTAGRTVPVPVPAVAMPA